jgi:hypothetical protein
MATKHKIFLFPFIVTVIGLKDLDYLFHHVVRVQSASGLHAPRKSKRARFVVGVSDGPGYKKRDIYMCSHTPSIQITWTTSHMLRQPPAKRWNLHLPFSLLSEWESSKRSSKRPRPRPPTGPWIGWGLCACSPASTRPWMQKISASNPCWPRPKTCDVKGHMVRRRHTRGPPCNTRTIMNTWTQFKNKVQCTK